MFSFIFFYFLLATQIAETTTGILTAGAAMERRKCGRFIIGPFTGDLALVT